MCFLMDYAYLSDVLIFLMCLQMDYALQKKSLRDGITPHTWQEFDTGSISLKGIFQLYKNLRL